MKNYKLKIIFSANDGQHEEHEVLCDESELQQEIQKNIDEITKYQDNMVKKWKTFFPMQAEDRQCYNKIDSEGYYQDGYLFMRESDLKRGYFEGRLEVHEI